MNRGIWKHLPVLFVATTLGLSFYAINLLLRSSSTKAPIQSLNYEMPRPESVERGYDLSGRKVVRTFEDLPQAPGAVAKAVDAQTAAKKAAEAAKEKARVDAKKKAADASALAAKKKAQAQKEAARKKAQMAVAIQEQQNKLRSSPVEKPTQASTQNAQIVPAKEEAPSDLRPTANTPVEDEVLHMSAAQWEARLMAEPTPANGYEFIKSFLKGYVEKAAFYQLSKKLLEDSQANRQQLALYILRQVPNETTFAFLTAEYATTSQDDLKLRIYSVLKEYATTASFPVLLKALSAQDVKVVQMSQEIIRVAVASQNPTPQSGNGRDARSPGSAPIAPAQFKMFLEPLQKLTGHNDQSVSQRAQTLIERIEALKPV